MDYPADLVYKYLYKNHCPYSNICNYYTDRTCLKNIKLKDIICERSYDNYTLCKVHYEHKEKKDVGQSYFVVELIKDLIKNYTRLKEMKEKNEYLYTFIEIINTYPYKEILHKLFVNKEMYLGDIVKDIQLSSTNGLRHIIELKSLGLVQKTKGSAKIKINEEQKSIIETMLIG
jgi:hypothetical protein